MTVFIKREKEKGNNYDQNTWNKQYILDPALRF